MSWHTVPKRYREATLTASTELQQKMIDAMVDDSNDLIIIGSVGTGKTHLSCGYINQLIKTNEFGGKYVTEYTFAELFTLRHSKDAETARDAEREIMHCKTYAVLVIDEVGKRELTDKQNIELDELISARYDNMLRTIIVSNLSAAQIKTRIGERASDRLRGNHAKVVNMVGDSLR